MLVLTRHAGESVLIGDQIKITVVEVGEHAARVQVAATRDVPVAYDKELRPNDPLMIGDGIELMIVEIRGRKVRLGITAPVELVIRREEVPLAAEAVDEQDK